MWETICKHNHTHFVNACDAEPIEDREKDLRCNHYWQSVSNANQSINGPKAVHLHQRRDLIKILHWFAKKAHRFVCLFSLGWIMEVTGPAVKLDIHLSMYSLQSLLWIPKAPTGQREWITQSESSGISMVPVWYTQKPTRGRCPGCILIRYPLDFIWSGDAAVQLKELLHSPPLIF